MSNKVVKGAAVIGIAGLIVKVLGAFFRIPLTNWIGGVGMSYYGFAYTIYGALLVLATAGIPIAISRLVSENIAKKQYKNAHKTFKVSLNLMFAIGAVSAAICFFGAGPITRLVGNPDAKMAVQAVAPALLFVPVLSAFRGYFQGRQNMNPTAITEVTEQLFRVLIGLPLAYILLSKGLKASAAGAAFGPSAGSIMGLAVMFLIYAMHKKVFKRKIELNDPTVESSKEILKKVIIIAVPIVIGSELLPIMNLIDMSIVMRRLQATGWSYNEAKNMYGLLSGFCNPIIAFPQLFTQAVAISLVPAIARAAAVKAREEIHSNVKLGFRITMVMAFPCAFGILALAQPILFLFYPAQKADAAMATPTLMLMSVAVLTLALGQTSTGILQAIGKQNLPVYHLLAGGIFKVVITFVLVGIPSVNIMGTVVGSVVAETIAFLLNMRSIKKYTGTKFEYNKTYLRPGIAAAAMGATVFFAHKAMVGLMGNSLATLISVALGGIVYGVLIFLFKAITVDEVENLPGGRNLAPIIRKVVK